MDALQVHEVLCHVQHEVTAGCFLVTTSFNEWQGQNMPAASHRSQGAMTMPRAHILARDHFLRQASRCLCARLRMEGPTISISGGQILLKAA